MPQMPTGRVKIQHDEKCKFAKPMQVQHIRASHVLSVKPDVSFNHAKYLTEIFCEIFLGSPRQLRC
jgi:hypothetical protein